MSRGGPDLVIIDSHESVLIMLQNAEQQVEDLKLQLDDALGAEEILVQLTERNLMLSEVFGYLERGHATEKLRSLS